MCQINIIFLNSMLELEKRLRWEALQGFQDSVYELYFLMGWCRRLPIYMIKCNKEKHRCQKLSTLQQTNLK